MALLQNIIWIKRNKDLERDTERVGTYSCIGAAEATKATVSSPVKPKKGENVNMQAITHGLVLLIVYLEEESIWVHLRKLANLQTNKRIDSKIPQPSRLINHDFFFLEYKNHEI